MKVLLLKDVYKLGHAGDIKKVADGYGRNYLIPQGLAVLATAGAVKQAESIRQRASEQRAILNNEMSGISSRITGATVMFSSKAGETGKLYGSITTQMIAEELNRKYGTEIDRRQIEVEPIRTLGTHKVLVRLTVDLVPEIKAIVYREGEAPAIAEAEEAAVEETTTEEQPAEETETSPEAAE